MGSIRSGALGSNLSACWGWLACGLVACGGPTFSGAASDGGLEATTNDGALLEGGADVVASQPDASCGQAVCVIAMGQATPVSIAIDAKGVYWANLGTSPGYADGTISKYDYLGRKTSVLLAVPGAAAVDVGVDGVHWVSQVNGEVGILGADGSNPGHTSLQGPFPQDLKADPTSVYVAAGVPEPDGGTGGAVLSLAASTADAVVSPFVASAFPIFHLALDADSVFWTEVDLSAAGMGFASGSVWKASKGTRAVTPIAQNEPAPFAIAVDAMYVYWSTLLPGPSGAPGIRRAPLAGGTAMPTMIVQTQAPVYALATDGANLYWAEFAPSGTVYKMANPSPGSPVTTIATSQPYPRALAVAGAVLAWVNAGTGVTADGSTKVTFLDHDGQVVLANLQ